MQGWSEHRLNPAVQNQAHVSKSCGDTFRARQIATVLVAIWRCSDTPSLSESHSGIRQLGLSKFGLETLPTKIVCSIFIQLAWRKRSFDDKAAQNLALGPELRYKESITVFSH